MLEVTDYSIDPHRLYDLNAAAPKVGLTSWHLREQVKQRKIAYLRHTPVGKIFFRGADLMSYLDSLRTPAIGEKARAAARSAIASNN
jgi:hypothetical protein